MRRHRTIRRFVSGVLVGGLVLSLGTTAPASADAAEAEVTPVDGLPDLQAHANFDLADVGYTQSEFFFSGDADAYGAAESPLPPSGHWTATPSHQAPYESRMVVNRPSDPADFSGTVVVEWFNVSGGVDAGPLWNQVHVEILRRGHAWVGVSAQFVGVNQLTSCPAAPPLPPGCLTTGDPDRYASLSHPGDSFSYDIYSQAGQAIRDQADVILGGSAPERLIAAGESQSAGRLTTYINGVHPVADVYDGFLVYSRGAAGSALRQSPQTPAITTPPGTLVRDDLDAPVLVFQTENDTSGLLARQPDNPGYRLWEVAGTAHFDQYGLSISRDDVGEIDSTAEWFDSMRNPSRSPDPIFEEIFGPCNDPINTGPATFVLRSALARLDRWIADGTPPPSAPRLEVDVGLPAPPGVNPYELDANGNAVGGIRTPAVDAPVATLSGFGQTGNNALFCTLFGTTVPLTDEQLDDLYRNHGQFAWRWIRATRSAERAGFLLREDARQLKLVGVHSDIAT
jgi:hypothetical protein